MLDSLVGIGTRLGVAKSLAIRAIGIELNQGRSDMVIYRALAKGVVVAPDHEFVIGPDVCPVRKVDRECLDLSADQGVAWFQIRGSTWEYRRVAPCAQLIRTTLST